MNAGTAFTATIDGTNYQFVTISDELHPTVETLLILIVLMFMRGTYVTRKVYC